MVAPTTSDSSSARARMMPIFTTPIATFRPVPSLSFEVEFGQRAPRRFGSFAQGFEEYLGGFGDEEVSQPAVGDFAGERLQCRPVRVALVAGGQRIGEREFQHHNPLWRFIECKRAVFVLNRGGKGVATMIGLLLVLWPALLLPLKVKLLTLLEATPICSIGFINFL